MVIASEDPRGLKPSWNPNEEVISVFWFLETSEKWHWKLQYLFQIEDDAMNKKRPNYTTTLLFRLVLRKEKLKILVTAHSYIYFLINLLNTRDRKPNLLLLWRVSMLTSLTRDLLCLVIVGVSQVQSVIWTSLDGELWYHCILT